MDAVSGGVIRRLGPAADALPDQAAVRDYLIGKGTDAAIAADAASEVELPLTVTKRGAVVWGRI